MSGSYTWEFGSEGSGLHFTIVYQDGQFTVNSLEGSFDLNALWWSDGDQYVDGDTTLCKADSSLNMNGSTTVWDDDGNATSEKLVWDGYQKLSSTGLGSDPSLGTGTDKLTFIENGETDTFTASQEFLAALAKAEEDGVELTLGVRATSVNGNGGIKYADTNPTYIGLENQAPTATEINVGATETQSTYDANHLMTNQDLPDDSDTVTVDLLDPAHVNDPDGDVLTVSNFHFFDADDNEIPQPDYITTSGNNLVIDQNSPSLNGLLDGEHLHLYVTYSIDDGNGHIIENKVNIDITGTADLYQLSSDVDASINYTSPFNTTTWDGSFNLDLNAPEGAFDLSGTASVTVKGDIDNDASDNANDESVTVQLEGGTATLFGSLETPPNQEPTTSYNNGGERSQTLDLDFSSAEDSISVSYDSNTAGGANGVDGLTSITVSVDTYDYWIWQ